MRFFFIALAALLLTACKVELYSNIPERTANEMLAVLLADGIKASKIPGKDNKVTLIVDQSQQERAIALLMARGLPKSEMSTIGDIFKKDGLISSQTEERARLIYAMSQELSHTLLELDGVISVRVHVVIPEKNNRRPAEEGAPASAAVFIKHQEDYDFSSFVPQIKTLVANSVEGLQYDHVSVVLFPSPVVDLPASAVKEGLTAFGQNLSAPRVAGVFAVLLILASALSVTFGYFILPRIRPNSEAMPES